MPFPVLVAAAFTAMVIQDFLAALLGVTEARGRALLSGLIAMAQDLMNLTTLGIGITFVATNGWTVESFVMVTAIMLAGFIGKSAGTWWGSREIDVDADTAEAYVAAEEIHVDIVKTTEKRL